MSTPITTLMLYRTELQPDNVVLDTEHHAQMLERADKFPVYNCTFQRQRREMRLPISMDVAGRYNYGSFQNDGKVFYCFITDMEYVNDNMTKASYNIDYWHTYQDDIEYRPSMIERKIVAKEDDVIGRYTADEPVMPSTFYLTDDWNNFEGYPTEQGGTWYILFDNGTQLTWNSNTQTYDGHQYAAEVTVSDNLDDIVTRLKTMNSFNDGLDSVQGIWAVPKKQFGNSEEDVKHNGGWSQRIGIYLPTTVDGYTIKNNKCKIAPFSYIMVQSSDGDSLTIKPQDVINEGDELAIFYCGHAIFPEPSTMVVPALAFKQSNGNRLMAVHCKNYPVPNVMASVISVSRSLKAVGSGISLMSGGLYAGQAQKYTTANGYASMANGATENSLNRFHALQGMQEATAFGNVGGAAVNLAQDLSHLQSIGGIRGKGDAVEWMAGAVGTVIAMYAPDKEQLKAIDHYFSRYGYAINEIQDIELHNRFNWDYVKTVDACISVPNAPVEAEVAIKNMFDSGLTIFHSATLFKQFDAPNN